MAQRLTIDAVRQKVDWLNSEAWRVRVSDSSHAFQLSQEAVALAKEAGYTKGLAEGLRSYGFALIRLSKHEEALPVLEESFSLFEILNDERGESEVYEYFGIIHRSLGNFDASLENLYKALTLSRRNNYQEETSLANYHLGVTYKYLGNFEKALEYLLESLRIAREIKYWVSESYALNLIGQVYFETEDYNQALAYYQQSLHIRKSSGDLWGEAGCLDNIGYTFYKLGSLSQAVEHSRQSLDICQQTGDKKGQANALFHLGEMFYRQGETQKAIAAASESLQIRRTINDKKGQAEVLLFLAEIPSSSSATAGEGMNHLHEALLLGSETKAKDLLAKIYFQFYHSYKALGKFEEALKSFEAYNQIDKQMHKDALAEKVINQQISHRAEQAKIEAENYRLRNVELAALYEELKKQKEETEKQKQKAEQALEELRSTQAQLIQKEKMASLGELTAGIAHEIQNPLNFINNFSETNKDLLSELKQAIRQNDYEEVEAIAGDLEKNEEKINHHGRRADAIVKGMLQHSRASAGEKQLTDINALAEEYLRLAFHGMRIKDNSFNVLVETHFDESIGKINVAPQEMGRVLVNLFNNAFYAVHEKKKNLNGTFEPRVSVVTNKADKAIEIVVNDNGTGIPQKVVDKIFQPFFTTKPTGEGTGLGLSLSYDIVTKGHGGELNVETEEGRGATFIIHLPRA